jgi:hypothetical protein
LEIENKRCLLRETSRVLLSGDLFPKAFEFEALLGEWRKKMQDVQWQADWKLS